MSQRAIATYSLNMTKSRTTYCNTHHFAMVWCGQTRKVKLGYLSNIADLKLLIMLIYLLGGATESGSSPPTPISPLCAWQRMKLFDSEVSRLLPLRSKCIWRVKIVLVIVKASLNLFLCTCVPLTTNVAHTTDIFQTQAFSLFYKSSIRYLKSNYRPFSMIQICRSYLTTNAIIFNFWLTQSWRKKSILEHRATERRFSNIYFGGKQSNIDSCQSPR